MRVLFSLTLIFFYVSINAQEKFSKEVNEISDHIIKQITSTPAKSKLGKDSTSYKVAIVSIENEDKKDTKLTELIENKIAINLAKASEGKYDVLDRNYIEQLLKEKDIPLQYDNKRDFAKNLGKIKAANFIVTGTLSNFENDFELNLQIIETKEGNIIGGATGSITSTELLREKNGQKSTINNIPKSTSQSSSAFEVPKAENKIEPISQPTTGTIEFSNKFTSGLVVLIGTEVVEPNNYGKKYEQFTIPGNSSDKLESVSPGVYYVCATLSREDWQGCLYTKRIVVAAGKTTTVNISR